MNFLFKFMHIYRKVECVGRVNTPAWRPFEREFALGIKEMLFIFCSSLLFVFSVVNTCDFNIRNLLNIKKWCFRAHCSLSLIKAELCHVWIQQAPIMCLLNPFKIPIRKAGAHFWELRSLRILGGMTGKILQHEKHPGGDAPIYTVVLSQNHKNVFLFSGWLKQVEVFGIL